MRTVLLTCLIATNICAFARSVSIQGIVKDNETKEPIPFAHIVVDEIITLTNLDGEFIVETSKDTAKLTLIVSVIGYDLATEPIEDSEEYFNIYLEPSITQLEDVNVLTGDALMREVFSRFHINYEMARHQMIGYYKENLLVDREMYYLAEGIVDIYVPPNIKFNQTLVSPIKTRKKVFKEATSERAILAGNASDMAESSIWRRGSFLSRQERRNYYFYYDGYSTIGTHNVFIVTFEPKNRKGNTSGKIYIDEKTMGILKLEYYPELSRTYWSDVLWTEEYYLKNGVYELFRVSYDGSWQEENENYHYQAFLLINEILSTNETPNHKGLLNPKHSFYYAAEDDFSDSFWAGYNYMKLDVASLALLIEQGVLVQATF